MQSVRFFHLALQKYRYFMAQTLCFESQNLQSELNAVQYFINPIYFIEWITILSVICDLEIPIFSPTYSLILTKISPYVVLGFHALIFTPIIIFTIKGSISHVTPIIRLLLRNYDRAFLIPCQIITMNFIGVSNSELIFIQVFNTIIIFLFSFTQCYYFQSIHFLPHTINTPFSKFSLLNIIVAQQIIIFQSIYNFETNMQYFCLLYFFYLIIWMYGEMTDNYSTLYYQQNFIYSLLIIFIISNIYSKTKDLQGDYMIYDFMTVVTIMLPLLYVLNQKLTQQLKSDTQSINFYQIYYVTYTNQYHAKSNALEFYIMSQLHIASCKLIKCPCKMIQQPFKEKNVISIILIALKQYMLTQRHQLSDQTILKYILFLYDVTKNSTQAHQTLLNYKKLITNGYILTILSVLEERLQIKIQLEISFKKNQMQFIEEMKLLKFEGLVLQNLLQKAFSAKFQLYESLKNRSISSFTKLYNTIYGLQGLVQSTIQKSIELQIYHNNNNIHNIFALRICHLISFLTQNIRESTQNQKKIDEIIATEIYKDDEFTNIAFTSNKAIGIVAKLTDKYFVEITSKITAKQIHFLQLDEAFQLSSISQILHPSFTSFHTKLIEQYLTKGNSKIVGNQIDTHFCPDPNLIVPVKLIIFPYFPQQHISNFQLIGYILKIQNKNNAIIILDYNFNIQSVDGKFLKLLDSYHLLLGQINLYQMIPQLKENLMTFHGEQNQAKPQYFQNQSIQILSRYLRPQINKSLNIIKNLDHLNQLSKIESINIQTTQTMNSMSLENLSLIDYEISLKTISYDIEDHQEYYVYYQLVIDLTQIEKQVNSNENSISDELQQKKETKTSKKSKKANEVEENKEYVRSLHSRNSTATVVKSSDDIMTFISSRRLPTAIKNFIILSSLNTIISLIGLFVIYALLIQKRSEQDVCFNKLYYGTEFLDYYGLILKGSRHTVFYRDFNKFLEQNQTITINETNQVKISISEKINFTLLLYQKNCKNLITLYEQYKDYLNGYQEVKLINFKYVGYQVSQTEVQVIRTQAAYYELMNTVFYLAMKTFAGDPSLYLKGTTDTFAQINTRGILFLNFNDVCDITQQFIEACLSNSQEYNNTFDNQVQFIFYVFYSFIVVFYGMLMFTITKVIQKIKQLLQIFQRLDSRDIDEELEKLEFINQNLKVEDFWFNSKFFSQFYEIIQDTSTNNVGRPQTLNLKLDDKFNVPSYYILQTLAVGLLAIFFVLLQVQYNSYSNQINPIVNTALSAIQIRLNFIKFVNNWDVYNFKTFYHSFVNDEKYAQYVVQNTKGNNKLLQLVSLNYTEIVESFKTQAREPFTNLTESMSQSLQHSLLLQDICFEIGCDMKNDMMFGRLLVDELTPYFQVGLIQLYQQTFQVAQSLSVIQVDSSSYSSFIESFLNSLYSKEYFYFIFWGLDATNYQLKQFSDYFIKIAKEELTQSTETIVLLLFVVGLLISLLILSITIFQVYQVMKNYFSIRFCVKFIPIKVMIAKNIIKQIKMII